MWECCASVNRASVRSVAGNSLVCLFALHVQAKSLKRVIDLAEGTYFQGGICRTSAEDINFADLLSQPKKNAEPMLLVSAQMFNAKMMSTQQM